MTASHRSALLKFFRKHKPFTIEGIKPKYAKIIEDELYSSDDFLNGFLDHMEGEFLEGAANEPSFRVSLRK